MNRAATAMGPILCFILILSKDNCFAWQTSESAKTLSALLDKLISEGKYFKDGKENNNDSSRWANDSNVIYFKLAPIGSYNLSFKPNNETTNIKSNNSTSLANLNRKPKLNEAQNVTSDIRSLKKVQNTKDNTLTKMMQKSQDVNQTADSALNTNYSFRRLFQDTNPINDSTTPSLDNEITYLTNTEEIKNHHKESMNNLLKVIDDQKYDEYSSTELYLDLQVDEMKSPQRKQAKEKLLGDAITYRVGYPANEPFDQPDGVSSVFFQPSLLGLEKPKIIPLTVFNYNAYPLIWCGRCKRLRHLKHRVLSYLHTNNLRMHPEQPKHLLADVINKIRATSVCRHPCYKGIRF